MFWSDFNREPFIGKESNSPGFIEFHVTPVSSKCRQSLRSSLQLRNLRLLCTLWMMTMHLVISIVFGCHILVSPSNRKDLQFFVLSCFHTSLDRTLDIVLVLFEFCKYGSHGLFTFPFYLLKTSLLFPFLIKQIEHYQRSWNRHNFWGLK